MPVKPIPAGYHSLTPGCAIQGCAKAIELYKKVFGAEVVARYDSPDGTVAHCEVNIGDSRLMLGESGGQNPTHNAHLMLYTTDCDAVFERAKAAGFSVKEPPTVQFWGDRAARVVDPHGNQWFIATHIEDVSDEEIRRRMAKLFGG